MSDFRLRLEEFIRDRNYALQYQQLTPDASTREYFRIERSSGPAIACIYPDAFVAAQNSYIDITNLFRNANLPVAEILDCDETRGIILLEDFGDRILREELVDVDEARREMLIQQAIALIPRIQAATAAAFATNSIASRLRFDVEKLVWELDFFTTHYFGTLQQQQLKNSEASALRAEFIEICLELESKATVLCHRDFHAANLMIDGQNQLRIIDHQDARIGSTAYDLVSLLLDRVTEAPSAEWLALKRRLFLDEREQLGLKQLDEKDFADEFRLQTIQRCLKAVGTFSFQSATRGKTHFVPFIKPMFQIVLRAAENLDRFPNLKRAVASQL